MDKKQRTYREKKIRSFSILFTMKYIFIVLIFVSCGTRKTEVVHKDSIVIENSYSQGSKTVLSNIFTYTPLDSLKPMVIEGKTYENAIVSNDKSKTVVKWKDRLITKKEIIYKTKIIDKKDNANIWIGIVFVFVFVLVIGLVIYFK